MNIIKPILRKVVQPLVVPVTGLPIAEDGEISWQAYWTPQKEPSTLIVTAQADTTIDFSWTAAAEPEDGYKLKISTDGITYTDKVTVNNATTTAQATGLTAGVLYYFKVVAYKGTHESIGTDVYDTRFKITIDTTKAGSANDTFVLPTAGAGTYNYFVDWGDGGAEENVVANTSQTHVYAAPGTYQIKIRGTFPQIFFNNAGDRAKLMTIDNWGNIIWSSMVSAFHGCSVVQGVWIDVPNTAEVISMSYMFYGCTAFNQSVANFDTAEVISMSYMFYGCSAFNQSVANFNTAKVTNMSYMFYGCTAFKQSLGTFSMTLVANLTSMLQLADINDTGTTTNYDATLISWSAQAVTHSKTALKTHFGSAKYGEGLVDSGTTDGVSAGKLIQSGQNFLTTVTIGDVVYNTTDSTYAFVTAIDSDTQLSISADIMASGEVYRIQHSDAAKARAQLVIPVVDGGQGWTLTDGGPA